MTPHGVAERRVLQVRGAGGVRLHTVVYGEADRPRLVVAHGAGSSSDFVAEAFGPAAARQGLALVAYDLRGHGRSGRVRGPAGHTLAHHAVDLTAVARSVGASVIGGVSLGAHAAVRAVAALPEVDGVLACLPAWTGRAIPSTGPHAAVARAVTATSIAGYADGLEDDPTLPVWLRRVLVRDWRRHDAASLTASLVALDGAEAPTVAELQSVPQPVAVVGWDGDPSHPLDVAGLWADALPEARLELAELSAMEGGVGHLGEVSVRTLVALGSVGEVPLGQDGLAGT